MQIEAKRKERIAALHQDMDSLHHANDLYWQQTLRNDSHEAKGCVLPKTGQAGRDSVGTGHAAKVATRVDRESEQRLFPQLVANEADDRRVSWDIVNR